MTPADVVLGLIYESVDLIAGLVPNLPSSWVSLANDLVVDAGDLLANVPYSNLVPWAFVGRVAAGLPLVMASALAARLVLRVWAMVRSRGVSE